MRKPWKRLFLLRSLFFLLLFDSLGLSISYGQSKMHKDTLQAGMLLEKVKVMKEKRQFQKGFDTIQEAQKVYEKWEAWDKYVHCYILMAKISDEINYSLKAEMAEKALQAAQSYLPKQHPFYAQALKQRGEAYIGLGNPDSSAYFLQQSIPVFIHNKDWENLAVSEILIAITGLHKGEFDSCAEHLAIADSLSAKYELEEGIPALVYSIYGVLYDQQGDYEKSILLTKKSLEQFTHKAEKDSSDSTHLANSYNNLGKWYDLKGDHQRALDCLTKAYHIYQKQSNVNEEKIIVCMGIGTLLSRESRYIEAVPYYETVEELLKGFADHANYQDYLMDCYVELGGIVQKQGKYDKALFFLEKALRAAKMDKRYIPLNQLAYLYNKTGKPDKAIPLLKEALQYNVASGYVSDFILHRINHNLGEAFYLTEDYKTALHYYQKSLMANCPAFKDSTNFRQNPEQTTILDSRYYLKSLEGKARTWAKYATEKDHLQIALNTYEAAIKATDSLRTDFATEGSMLLWNERIRPFYAEAITVAYQLYEEEGAQKYLEQAFRFSEKSKGGLLLESIRASEGRSLAGMPDSLIQQENNFNIDLAFYEKLLLEAKQDSAKTVLYQNYYSSIRLELASLKEQMEAAYPAYFQLKYERPETNIAVIQKELLKKEAAMLSYFMANNRSFVFVITTDEVKLLPLEGIELIDNAALTFQEVLTNPLGFRQSTKNAFNDYHKKSAELYRLILEPALKTLPASTKELVIIPDGTLHSIPFEVLTENKEQDPSIDFSRLPYLLKRYEFHYTLSANLLLKNRQHETSLKRNNNCLAIAPPYKLSNSQTQSDDPKRLPNAPDNLQGTSKEIEAIAQYFDGYFDTEKKINELEFKAMAPEYGLIHLAMHGQADFEHPNFAHLQFSNLDHITVEGEEDNLLHHYEITNLPLCARLVVLSACETGRGQYAEGEGVFSLARSFMYAGVPSIVMSLWKVSDESTSMLMPRFYEQLAAGKSKSEALHQAKISFLETAPLKFRHPYYWSGFILLGDNRPINAANENMLLYVFVLLGLIAAAGLGKYFYNKNYTKHTN